MDSYVGSLEEHVENDVSGQGITSDELERRWSGEFRVSPEPVVEPEMPESWKRAADELFYGPKFSSSYYGR